MRRSDREGPGRPSNASDAGGAALCAYLLDAAGVNEGSDSAGTALAVLITLLLVMSLCGLLSAVIEIVAYRPLSNAPRLSRLVTAVGVLLILTTSSSFGQAGPRHASRPASTGSRVQRDGSCLHLG